MTTNEQFLNILYEAGASPELVEVFIEEEIDMEVLKLMNIDHFHQLHCPMVVMNEIMRILNNEDEECIEVPCECVECNNGIS